MRSLGAPPAAMLSQDSGATAVLIGAPSFTPASRPESSVTTSAPLSTEPANAYPGRWKAMAVVALAVSIIIMDGTVVNVVMPVLIRDLGLTAADAEWVNSVYSLV